jgi:hypothetical protein
MQSLGLRRDHQRRGDVLARWHEDAQSTRPRSRDESGVASIGGAYPGKSAHLDFIDSLKSIIWVGFNLPDMAFSLAV